MSKYCANCNNLVVFDNAGSFLCTLCGLKFKMTDEETLMEDVKKPNRSQQYTYLVYGTPKDPAAKISKIKCDKCNKYKRVMHLGTDEMTIFVCECIYS